MRAILFILASATACASAQTTIEATNRYAYGANIGWIDLRGNTTIGLRVSDHVCSGSACAANVGWIAFGDGTPATGISYANNSATDYGVNVTNFDCPAPGVHTADLRGYAYGANIGWINFENTGDPRIDLTIGKLRGYAWSANVGWINLGELSPDVEVVTTLVPGVDSDNDNIADAWEYSRGGFPNLTALGSSPESDADGDGSPDLAEYMADTDPFDPQRRLQITEFVKGASAGAFDMTFTTSPTRVYRVQGNPDLSSPWTNVLGPLKPTGFTLSATVTEPGSDTLHFWRATAALPLQP